MDSNQTGLSARRLRNTTVTTMINDVYQLLAPISPFSLSSELASWRVIWGPFSKPILAIQRQRSTMESFPEQPSVLKKGGGQTNDTTKVDGGISSLSPHLILLLAETVGQPTFFKHMFKIRRGDSQERGDCSERFLMFTDIGWGGGGFQCPMSILRNNNVTASNLEMVMSPCRI